MRAPVTFEKFEVHGDMNMIPDDVMASIKKNRVCLKGELITPVGEGVNLLNPMLRKELDLYVSLVSCFNLRGLPSRHENVDIVVIRENTEGEYSGLEHEVDPGVVESLKVITKFCSERISITERLEIAKRYPNIKYNEIIVDNCCMQLVSKPEQFDVMVTPNLYGNLVANIAAGIAGGTGVMLGDFFDLNLFGSAEMMEVVESVSGLP
ncbi:unnamed protein product [Lactuca saligna]|uniref:Isopropylmalate dehydrogenase-like domain-containing protein n=1 Tax=Lactuca saligna TaxID=75948 RepID=A0AA36A132_LACSI|nr:unnamed protein product [Lactuca saligna]